MAKVDRAKRAYDFLQERSRDQASFTYSDVEMQTGWKHGTVTVYCSKHWKDFLSRQEAGWFKVQPEFQRITLERFLALSTQRKTIFSLYQRVRYEQFVSFEFLLPLSREGELRRALDELFYLDTVCQRLSEIGLTKLVGWMPRENNEAEVEYLDRVARYIGDRFGGYSISHVSGRFRKVDLLSRSEAAQLLEQNYEYLIDETTASVRFIFPVAESRTDYEDSFGRIDRQKPGATLQEMAEINLIHEVFLELFAEAAVRTVGGEDEIWLVEESPLGRYLYVWRKS